MDRGKDKYDRGIDQLRKAAGWLLITLPGPALFILIGYWVDFVFSAGVAIGAVGVFILAAWGLDLIGS